MTVLTIALAAVLIGVAKAGFGGGTGVLVGPLLMLVLPPRESLGLMLPLLVACDLATLGLYWGRWDRRNVLLLLPGALAGIYLGFLTLNAISDVVLARSVGALAIGFGILQLVRDAVARNRPAFAPPTWLGGIVGVACGYVSTVSHNGGVMAALYLLPQRMENDRLVATSTIVFFVINLGKTVAFLENGMLDGAMVIGDLPYVPLALLGTMVGLYLNRRMSSAWFTRIVLVIVLVTGTKLLIAG